jgi:hypothetical protein
VLAHFQRFNRTDSASHPAAPGNLARCLSGCDENPEVKNAFWQEFFKVFRLFSHCSPVTVVLETPHVARWKWLAGADCAASLFRVIPKQATIRAGVFTP